MSYTLGTAAKATGYTKPTIRKAIADGKLSATKNEQGHYQIDPSELQRVYPVEMREVETSQGKAPVNTFPPVATVSQGEIDALKQVIEEKERTIERLEEDKQTAAKNADDWKDQAKSAQLLLTHIEQQAKPEVVEKPRKPMGFWEWWKQRKG